MKLVNHKLKLLHQKQSFLQLMILTLIVIMVWIGISLFRTQTTTEISPDLLKMAQPLNPTIDQATIVELEQKKAFSNSELRDFPIYKIITSQDKRTQRIVTIDVEENPPSPSPTPSPSPKILPVTESTSSATTSSKTN